MINHKVILIGAVGSGKSTLLAGLTGSERKVVKTQAMVYDSLIIDTPGEYLENPRMYKYIIAASQDVKYVMFIQDSTRRRCIYPPGFAQSFKGQTFGVITKVDSENSDVELNKKFLQDLVNIKGPIFEISAKTGYGINELKNYIKIE